MAAVETATGAVGTTAAPGRARVRGRVRDLRGFWRCTLAVLAPLPMLALAVEVLVVPFPVRGDIRQAIAGAAAHPGSAQVALWLALIFAVAIVPATMAVLWTARRGAPRLTLAAGVALLIGFGATLPDSDLAAVNAAQKRLDPALVAALDGAVWAHPAVGIHTVLFLLGQAVGLILLGIALWRARVLPAWLGLLLAASGPAHLLMPGNASAAASWALTAIGYGGASIALLRTGNAAFDLPPEGAPAGQPPAPSSGRDARTAWRWLLALAAVPVAVFVTVLRYLLPYGGADQPREIFDKLVAAHAFESAVIWFGSLVVLTGFAGVLAVAWVTRRRTPVLTTIAMCLAVPGYIALFAGGSYGDVLAYVTGTVPGLDRETAFQLGSGMEASPQSNMLITIFVAGHLLGTVLLGIALWRAKVLPTWIAIGLTVSQPIHLASVLTDIRSLDLVGWGLTAIGFAAAAWKLLRMTNDEFDLRPAPAREPANVG
jgi:hypothetical protein